MASSTMKYKMAKTAVEEAKKVMKEAAKDAMQELVGEFFPKYPSLLSFGWSQYTPYWNDGETCVFSANTEYPTVTFTAKDGKVVKVDENNGETTFADDETEMLEEDFDGYEKEAERFIKAVSKLLKDFDEDDLQTMFGDHVLVTINRNGKIETEDYEHE